MSEKNQKTSRLSNPDGQFPRTSALPTQSPIYWVNQKDRYLRQLMIRDIEAITERRLFVYFANRFCIGSDIDDADPAYICEMLSDYGGEEPADLLIETNGGKTDSTEAIVSILRNRIADLRVIVANAAKSNGTLICLTGRSIVMGPPSELGPVDPSIQGTPCTILAQPQMAQMNFALHQAAILFLKQTEKLAISLLREGMLKDAREGEAERVAKTLGTRDTYFSHGSTIDHREAQELGLNIEVLGHDDELWQRVWLLYSMYDYDCRREGFLKVFESRTRSTSVRANPQPPA